MSIANLISQFYGVFLIAGLVLTISLLQLRVFPSLRNYFSLQPSEPRIAAFVGNGFVHSDLDHLLNNLRSFIPMALIIIYLFGNIALFSVVIISLLMASAGIVLCSDKNTMHLGFSGACFGCTGFFLADFIRCSVFSDRIPVHIVIDVVIIYWYLHFYKRLLARTSLNGRRLSVEGHLFGFMGGITSLLVLQ